MLGRNEKSDEKRRRSPRNRMEQNTAKILFFKKRKLCALEGKRQDLLPVLLSFQQKRIKKAAFRVFRPQKNIRQ